MRGTHENTYPDIKDIICILAGILAGSIVCTYHVGLLANQPRVQAVGAYEVQPAPSPTPEPVIEWKTAILTAYTCEGLTTQAQINMNCPSLNHGEPKTASGTKPSANRTLACDRSMMGTKLILEGLEGEYTCEDLGGRIVDNKIDIYMPDYQTAIEFGRKEVRYYERD